MVFPRATCVLVGPRRRLVAAVARDLPQVLSVATDGVNLNPSASSGREREMPSVRRIRWSFVGALAERELSCLAGAEVVNLDVESSAARTRREGDLVER